MKFSSIKYSRPDLLAMKNRIEGLLNRLSSSANVAEQIQIVEEVYRERAHFETMSNLASIRHTIDTADKFYEEEQKFFDANYPLYQDLINAFYKVLIKSDHREALEKKFGRQLFNIAEVTIKSFSPEIIEE